MNRIDTSDLRQQLAKALTDNKIGGTVEVGVDEEMQYVWARWDTKGTLVPKHDLHMLSRAELSDFARGYAPMVAGFIQLCQRGGEPRTRHAGIPINRWDPA